MACQQCPPSNPCTCLAYAYWNMLPNGSPAPVPITPCSNEEECLRLANLYVGTEDSVGPCNEAGVVQFPEDCFDFSGCDGTPNFRVYSISDPTLLTVQSLTATQMNFTALPGSEGKAITVVIEAWCGHLRAYGSVTIIIKNPCTECPLNFGCNPCSDVVCAQLTGGSFDAPGPHATTTEVIGTEGPARVYTIEAYDEDVLENVAVDGSGNVSYDIICTENLPTTTTVTVGLDASGAVDTADVVINIDLCDGVSCDACEYCDPCDGVCKAHPAKTVTITSVSPSGLVESEAIDNDEVITYTEVCSGLLPATAIFTYNVVECGVTTTKTQEILIACPADCCECPVLDESTSPNPCSDTIDVTTGKVTKSGSGGCVKIWSDPGSGDFTVDGGC